VDGLVGRGQFLPNAPAVLVQPQAHVRGLKLARGAAQQLRPELLFELLEAVADVGPAHVQAAGGFAQVAGIQDVHQQAQGNRIKRGHGGITPRICKLALASMSILN